MQLDTNILYEITVALWCPLCSGSWRAVSQPPFRYVMEIPTEAIVIPEERKALKANETHRYWVCERCCKREGLVW